MSLIHELDSQFASVSGFESPEAVEQVRGLPPVDLVVATSNEYRVGAILQWASGSGLHIITRNVVNGWISERGQTAAEKAGDKVFHSAFQIYPYINPDHLTLIIAADSVDRHDGDMREKPNTTDQFLRDRDEWLEAAMGQSAIKAETGNAAMVMHKGRFGFTNGLYTVSMWPVGVEAVTRSVNFNSFEEAQKVAHSLGAHPLIHAGDIRVTEHRSGSIDFRSLQEFPSHAAMDAVHGVLPHLIGNTVEQAVSQFDFLQ